jgi:hypothetical protein
MDADRGVVRRAAQLVAISEHLRQEGLGQAETTPRPISWPALTPEEATEEWPALRQWVEQLVHRFPNITRLPDCWWRHNDLVEALSALRDYEHACFATTAPAAGPVEWQRALRDIEARIEVWTKRFTCTVPGRGHDPADATSDPVDSWTRFIEADVNRRRSGASYEQMPQRA